MKIPRAPHSFALSPKRAVEVQRELAGRVRATRPRGRLRFVAGVDCAFSSDGADCLAAAVVWDVTGAEVVEERIVHRPLRFPYVPGLLSFRELPAVLAALRAVRAPVDAVLTDGHGFAHPRRFGIACHLGVLCGVPTAGVAKSVLVGDFDPPGKARGERTPLVHRDEVVGTVLRTRDDTKPVFVSIGHHLDLTTAERLVLECGAGFRLPEPTRRADRAVAAAKRA